MTSGAESALSPAESMRLSWWARHRLTAWLGLAVTMLILVLLARATTGYILRMRADAARDRKDYDRAEALYRAAHAWYPTYWRAPLGIAQVFKARAVVEKDPARQAVLTDEAIRWYESGWELNRYDLAFPYGLYQLYGMKGEQAKALALLQDVVGRHPLDGFFQTRLALQLHEMGREDEAMAHFQTALKLEPTNSLARTGVKMIEAARSRRAASKKPAAASPPPPAPAPHS